MAVSLRLVQPLHDQFMLWLSRLVSWLAGRMQAEGHVVPIVHGRSAIPLSLLLTPFVFGNEPRMKGAGRFEPLGTGRYIMQFLSASG